MPDVYTVSTKRDQLYHSSTLDFILGVVSGAVDKNFVQYTSRVQYTSPRV